MFKTSQSYAAKNLGVHRDTASPGNPIVQVEADRGALVARPIFHPRCDGVGVLLSDRGTLSPAISLFTVKVSLSIPQEKSTSGIVLSNAGGICGLPKAARKLLNFNEPGKNFVQTRPSLAQN
jgi:hypothetical protein